MKNNELGVGMRKLNIALFVIVVKVMFTSCSFSNNGLVGALQSELMYTIGAHKEIGHDYANITDNENYKILLTTKEQIR